MEKQVLNKSQMSVIWSPKILRSMEVGETIEIPAANYSAFYQAKTRVQIETGMNFTATIDKINRIIIIKRES